MSATARGQSAPAPVPAPAAPAPAAPPNTYVTSPAPAPAPAPVLAPAPAPAAPGPEAPPPPLAPTTLGKPLIDVRVAEPAPALPRSVRMHNGFYLRLSAGALYGGTFVASDTAGRPDYTADGFGFSFDAMAGGTVSGSLAVGGAAMGQGFGMGGNSGTSSLFTLGPFVDGFPMPNDGLHMGGMLGLSMATASHSGSKYTGFGPGMAAWFGYDGWVADEWSMGGLLKLSGALTWGSSHDPGPDVSLSAATYELTLLFSVLYH